MINNHPTEKTFGSASIQWEGKHAFLVAGTGHDDDTLRIVAQSRGQEEPLTLILPTLCITYADMVFANAIGGVQEDYPDSAVYGQDYFNPPVVIDGEKKIEKFTWIRGAKRIEIGPVETTIEWFCWKTLVIPKLRIKAEEKIVAIVKIPEVSITESVPFVFKAMQYTDGRHVGGIQFTKRHPDWKSEPVPQKYDLWVRVIDGKSRRAIPQARVNLFSWSVDEGRFVPEAFWFTNKMGIVDVSYLPCADKKLVTIENKAWLTQTWRFRPFPTQKVNRTFKLWRGKRCKYTYQWRVQDKLKDIARLTGVSQPTILHMNHLRRSSELKQDQIVEISCFEADYYIKSGEKLEGLVDYFCYDSIDELAEVNDLPKPYILYQDLRLHLPGWHFFLVRSDELFEQLDEQFGLPRGWSRPAVRILHDNPTRAYEHEVIAIPTLEFVRVHKLRD